MRTSSLGLARHVLNRIMWKAFISGRVATAICFVIFSLLLFGGCGSRGGSRAAPPKVDPRAAAAEAIRLYDKNGDGSLDELETGACPAIKRAREGYDKDGNGKISQDEISQHLESIYSVGVGLLEVQCTVLRNGRPLSGATVRFIPEPFLGGDLQTAIATTDADGVAIPSIPAEKLPGRLRNASLMQVGLYRVEIEHPTLSADHTKGLGFEVDPTRRGGTTASFDLH
jgi:hypothetical protein